MSERQCRLCLNRSSESYKNIEDEPYMDQLKLIIPEIDLTLTESPVICDNCSMSLSSAYTFKLNCLETERELKVSKIEQNKNTIEKTDFFEELVKEEPLESDYDNESESKTDEKSPGNNFTCKFCGKQFLSHQTWYSHFKSHTGTRFNCGVCSESFNNRSDFLNHKQTHRGINKCPVCGKIFLYKAVLDRHTKQHDGLCGIRVFECNFCGLKTKLKCKLTEHLRIHTGERPYKCSFCDKAFTQSSTLSTHVKSMHKTERPFVCEVCGRSYAVRGQYTAHMRTHSSDIPKNCVCSYCGKCYTIESRLQAHLRRHTGEKPVICDVCSKRLSDMNGLKKHMRIHTGEKPYECQICQKRFSQKSNMYIHFKSCARRNAC